jgi:hypothetical protein
MKQAGNRARNQHEVGRKQLLRTCFILGSEDGGDMFLQNIWLSADCTALYPEYRTLHDLDKYYK